MAWILVVSISGSVSHLSYCDTVVLSRLVLFVFYVFYLFTVVYLLGGDNCDATICSNSLIFIIKHGVVGFVTGSLELHLGSLDPLQCPLNLEYCVVLLTGFC